MADDHASARRIVEDAMDAWMAGDDKAFWRLVAEDVQYDVIGTTPVSGHYDGRREFFEKALFPMSALLAQGARPVEYDIVAEGPRVVLMWTGVGTMKNGAPYDNSYCWVLTVVDREISAIKAYLDTELVSALFAQG